MIKLLVIADDFTGALDTGVQFSKKGIATLVTYDLEINFQELAAIEVLVINTETRHKNPREAFLIVLELTKKAKEAKINYLYKKVDSTLRGNIGCELEACKIGAAAKNILFVPAYPKNFRTTKDGIHYVNGLPLSETSFGKDPFNFVISSRVKNIISAQTKIITKEIRISQLDELSFEEEGIYIFDCENSDDLDKISLKLDKDKMKLSAGCAGFAEILSQKIQFKKSEREIKIIDASFLLISGSVNPIAGEQIIEEKEKGTPLLFIEDYINLYKTINAADLNDLIKAVSLSRKETKNIMLSSSAESLQLLNKIEGKSESIRHQVAKNLGYVTAALIKKIKINNLIVFGGDTLMEIIAQFEEKNTIPLDEIEPGVVFLKFNNFNIISKSGGLGSKNAIAKISSYLQKNQK